MAEVQRIDVAVVGAGPAGIAAACRAAEGGARVLLLDEAPAIGGQIWRPLLAGQGLPRAARRWLARLRTSGASVRAGVRVVDVPEPHWLLAASADGSALHVQTRTLVLATGARERFLPFPGWALPGVLGAGGAQALLKSGASLRGLRVAVAGSGPLLLPVAAGIRRAGAELLAVVEQAPAARLRRLGAGLLRRPGKLWEALAYRLRVLPSAYRWGTWVTAAEGGDRLEAITLSDGRTTACDVLAVGYGLVPNLELPRLIGCSIEKEGVRVDENQQTSVPAVYAAGEASGIGGLDQALPEGQIAGLAAIGRAEAARPLFAARAQARSFAAALAAVFALRPELRAVARPDTIVCRCEDVPLGRLDPLRHPRQAKLATRCGMGPCQGRVCGPALEFLFGWPADTARPPLKPVSLAILKEDTP